MDIDYLLFLQGLREATGGVFDEMLLQFSTFSDQFTALLIISILYWCVSKRMGIYVLMGWSFNRLANGFLKITFCVYRPWIRDPRIHPYEAAIGKATGYSFPSGHTTNATSMFGGPAMRRELSRPLRIGLWAMVILTGLSRNWVGVHTPQDVVVAFAAAVALMLLAGKVLSWLDEHPEKDVVVSAAIALVSLVLIAYASLKSYPMDYDEAGNLIVDPEKMAIDSFKNAGWALGFAVGWLAERRLVSIGNPLSVQQGCIRATLGSLALLFVYFPLTAIVRQFIPGGVGASVGCLLQTLTVVLLMPYVFSRLERQQTPELEVSAA